MRTGRPQIHDWTTYLNGKPHLIRKGHEFHSELQTMRIAIYNSAKAANKHVAVRLYRKAGAGAIIFQAYEKRPNEGEDGSRQAPVLPDLPAEYYCAADETCDNLLPEEPYSNRDHEELYCSEKCLDNANEKHDVLKKEAGL